MEKTEGGEELKTATEVANFLLDKYDFLSIQLT